MRRCFKELLFKRVRGDFKKMEKDIIKKIIIHNGHKETTLRIEEKYMIYGKPITESFTVIFREDGIRILENTGFPLKLEDLEIIVEKYKEFLEEKKNG